MGVIYKLKPEIRDYIIKIQSEKPNFGCRKLSALLSDKFQINVSKSSINYVIKSAGLSKPVGRRPKLRRGFSEQEIEGTGEILLKAVDLLVGGDVYLADLEKEVRCIKVDLFDGGNFYLDGQLRTVWPSPNIPYNFSTTNYISNSYVKKHFQDNHPFILFTAPGYDKPSPEFFDFILSLNSNGKAISKLTFYSNKLEELKNIPIGKNRKGSFIFGLWPWQFSNFRKVNSIGEFKLFFQENLKKDLFLANIEIELSQPTVNTRVTLKGCALKADLAGKINLVILSNLDQEQADSENLANLYLLRWPNLEEGFQDFSRKSEFFTYSAGDQYSFSLQGLELDKKTALDFYLRWHFFPAGYEKSDFLTMSDRFYKLKTKLKIKKDFQEICFQFPSGYLFTKDLEYACRRLNEMDIVSNDGKKIMYLCS